MPEIVTGDLESHTQALDQSEALQLSVHRLHPTLQTHDDASETKSIQILDKSSGHHPYNDEEDSHTSSSLESDSPRQRRIRSKIIPFKTIPQCEPGEPPDGGPTAWLHVLAGHLTFFIKWGFIASFGVFQTYYGDTMHASPSTISWIGTSQMFFLLFFGAFSGRASDAGYAHEAVLLGTSLIVFGNVMTSFAKEYYQFFLAHGVCTGTGMGALFTPGLSVPSSYFKRKKAIAVALIVAGSGVGGVVYPVMVQQLMPKIGFAWTMRSLALVTLLASITINSLLRMRIPPRKTGPLVDWAAFRQVSYSVFTVGFFLIYWALYFAFYYIDKYGRDIAHFSSSASINLLLVTNGTGILGRVLPGFIASRWLGPLNTAIPTACITAIPLYCWTAIGTSKEGLFALAVVFGIFAAAIQSLFIVSLAAITEDLSMLGTRMGMVFSVVAFAALTGSPIAGAIIQDDHGHYLGAQLWAATSMALGAVALVVSRVARTGLILKAKI